MAKKRKKPFKVCIRWGSKGSFDTVKDHPLGYYEFNTLGELNAFLEGVDEAVGWMDHEQIDEPTECKKCGTVYDKSDISDGLCHDCHENEEEEEEEEE